MPVLAIMAKNPFFPPNVEESFRALAPKMDFRMWDGVGHFLMMEKPKEFNDAVLAWLDRNKPVSKPEADASPQKTSTEKGKNKISPVAP